MIVAGACRHFRLYEFLLDGVTRSLLREYAMPLQLSQ
jgi:hypothetical protein